MACKDYWNKGTTAYACINYTTFYWILFMGIGLVLSCQIQDDLSLYYNRAPVRIYITYNRKLETDLYTDHFQAKILFNGSKTEDVLSAINVMVMVAASSSGIYPCVSAPEENTILKYGYTVICKFLSESVGLIQ